MFVHYLHIPLTHFYAYTNDYFFLQTNWGEKMRKKKMRERSFDLIHLLYRHIQLASQFLSEQANKK